MYTLLWQLLHSPSQARQNRKFPNHFNFLDRKMVWFPNKPNQPLFLLTPQPSCDQYNHAWLATAFPTIKMSEHWVTGFPAARGGLCRAKFGEHRQQRHTWTSCCISALSLQEMMESCTPHANHAMLHLLPGPSASPPHHNGSGNPAQWQGWSSRVRRTICCYSWRLCLNTSDSWAQYCNCNNSNT